MGFVDFLIEQIFIYQILTSLGAAVLRAWGPHVELRRVFLQHLTAVSAFGVRGPLTKGLFWILLG